MTADTLAPYLAFFAAHVYVIVFVVSMIDATGVPFPGRFLLIVAGALATGASDALVVGLLAAAGTVCGDHILYLMGRLGGDKVVSLYCRWTLGSAHCVKKAKDYFRRYGGLTIIIGRFVTSVRIFATALAGAGGIRYPLFLLFDVVGALMSATVFVFFGYFLGDRATRVLQWFGNVGLIVGVVLAVSVAGFIVYRVWKRKRHGPAIVTRPRPA